MKIISLGGGTAGVIRVRLSGRMTKTAMSNRIENGSEIWDNLMYAGAPVFSWADEIGEFEWAVEETGVAFGWQEVQITQAALFGYEDEEGEYGWRDIIGDFGWANRARAS